jgi:hypothetical protein
MISHNVQDVLDLAYGAVMMRGRAAWVNGELRAGCSA